MLNSLEANESIPRLTATWLVSFSLINCTHFALFVRSAQYKGSRFVTRIIPAFVRHKTLERL